MEGSRTTLDLGSHPTGQSRGGIPRPQCNHVKYRMPSSGKVVFVAYSFPPHSGAGVHRSLKFVKYLPEFGWRPLVVTSGLHDGDGLDWSLAKQIPVSTPVHRVPGFSIRKLRARCSRWGLGKAATLLNLVLQTPDTALFWARNCRSLVLELVAAEKPDLIFTTSPPGSSHLLGLWARSRFGIPWFADFRDPWSGNLVVPYLPGYRRLNRRLERKVLAKADRVACVSDPWLDDLQANLGAWSGKFLTLPNGYDETDVAALPLPDESQPFTLTHIGSFYRNRRPESVVQAVKTLVRQGRIPEKDLRVVFVGRDAPSTVRCGGPFESVGYVPHNQLEPYRRRTDALLVILDASAENRGNCSGKLYECLACNRPILAVATPGGAAHQVIQESRTGVAVKDDVASIANAIERLYLARRGGNAQWDPDWSVIERHTRRKLTGRLAAEFDRLVAERGLP